MMKIKDLVLDPGTRHPGGNSTVDCLEVVTVQVRFRVGRQGRARANLCLFLSRVS